jgi:hypothetical protein
MLNKNIAFILCIHIQLCDGRRVILVSQLINEVDDVLAIYWTVHAQVLALRDLL